MSVVPPQIAFEDASELPRHFGGENYTAAKLPITVSRFQAGRHTCEGMLSSDHLLVISDKCSGTLHAEIANTSKTLETYRDMLIFAPCSAEQFYDFNGTTENIVLTMDGDFMSQLAIHWNDGTAEGLLDPLLNFRNPRVAHLMKELVRTMDAQHAGWRIYAEAFGMQIGAELLGQFSTGNRRRGKPVLSPEDIETIEEYIRAYIGLDIGLSDLAEIVNLDIFAFSRAFKAATGQSPGRFLLRRRVEEACRLLRSTQMSLAEIAYKCGFSSQAHMTTTLKKHTGATPGKYRKNR